MSETRTGKRALPARLLRRLGELRKLAAARKYDALADELIGRLFPAPNPLLFWDKFVIVGLGEARSRARAVAPPVLAAASDIEQLCTQHPGRAARYRRRVADGQECWIYRDGERIVARQWLIGDRPLFDTNAGWKFRPPVRPAVWSHDLYIDPAYRLRGFFVGFMENARQPRAGTRPHVYAEIHFRNGASLNSCTRYGFEVVHEVTMWTLLGARSYVVKRPEGERRVDFAFSLRSPAHL